MISEEAYSPINSPDGNRLADTLIQPCNSLSEGLAKLVDAL